MYDRQPYYTRVDLLQAMELAVDDVDEVLWPDPAQRQEETNCMCLNIVLSIYYSTDC